LRRQPPIAEKEGGSLMDAHAAPVALRLGEAAPSLLRGVLMLLALVFIVLGRLAVFEYATKNAWDVAEAELDRSDPHCGCWRSARWPPLADDENGARHRRDRRRWIGPGFLRGREV